MASSNKMVIDVELNTRPAVTQAKRVQRDINKALSADTKNDPDLIQTKKNLEDISGAANDAAKAFSNYYLMVSKLRKGLEKSGYSNKDLETFRANKAELEKQRDKLEKDWSLKWQDKPTSRGAQTNRADLANVEKKLDLVRQAEDLERMGNAATEFVNKFSVAGNVADDLNNGIANLTDISGVLVQNTDKFVASEAEASQPIQDAADAAKNLETSMTAVSDAAAKGASNNPMLDNITREAPTIENSLKDLVVAYAELSKEYMELRSKGEDTNKVQMQLANTAAFINKKLDFNYATSSAYDLTRQTLELKKAMSSIQNMNMPASLSTVYNKITAGYTKATASLSTYNGKLKRITSAQDDVKKSAKSADKSVSSFGKSASKVFSKLSSVVKTVKSGFKSLSSVARRVTSSFDGMSGSMRGNFKHLITSLTKYVLGFRSLFFLVRRLRKYVGEGIQNLVKFNGGVNDVNYAITNMLSSLLFLKNAWAAAFSPVITIANQLLPQLIDRLAEVGNAVAKFIGALTGQEVVFNAVKVDAQDYASTLDDVGGSAGGAADKTKKLTDRLAAFDDLNVLGVDNDPDSTGSGGGGGLDDAYTPDPNEMFKIVGAYSRLGQLIHDAFLNGFDFFEVGLELSDNISRALRNISWEEIKQNAKNAGSGIRSLLLGLFGDKDIWIDVGHTLAEGLNTAFSFVNALLGPTSKQSNSMNFGKGLALLVNQFLYDVDWEAINTAIIKFVDKLRDNIISFLRNLDWSEIKDVAKDFGATLANILNETIGDVKFMATLGVTLAENFNTLLAGFNEFFDTLDPEDLGSSIAAFIEKTLTTIDWEAVGHSISGSASTILNAFAKAFEETPEEEITNAITAFFEGIDWASLIGALVRFIVASANSATMVAVAISDAVNQIVSDPEFADTIAGIVEAIFANLDVEGIVEALTAFTVVCFEALLATPNLFENIVKGFIKGLIKYFEEYHSEDDAEDLANMIAFLVGGPIIEGLAKGVEDAFNKDGGVLEWVKALIFGPIVLALDELFDIGSPSKVMEEKGEFLIEGLKNGINNLMPDVEQIFTDFKSWLDTTWYNIRTTAVSNFWTMKSKIVEAFEAIRDGVKGIINNGILPTIENMINYLIDGLNGLVSRLNELPDIQITNPLNGQTLDLGISLPSIGHVSIPRLAQGAVIPPNREFMAVLGDQSSGTNIEAPLDTIKQAVADVMGDGNAEVVALLQQLIEVVASKELVVGDKEIGQANARYTQRQNRVRGVGF